MEVATDNHLIRKYGTRILSQEPSLLLLGAHVGFDLLVNPSPPLSWQAAEGFTFDADLIQALEAQPISPLQGIVLTEKLKNRCQSSDFDLPVSARLSQPN